MWSYSYNNAMRYETAAERASAVSYFLNPAVAERLDTAGMSDEARTLVEQEREIPVVVGIDTSLRPKILDACGMSCVFCHNEGTPVAAAHSGTVDLPNPRYKGGRVSVFESLNNVNFLPGRMQPGEQLGTVLGMFKDALGVDELHLTGGEPSLHPDVADVVRTGVEAGYEVKMTSNGENTSRVIADCAEAGLQKVNFSIFGTTAQELADVQHPRFRSTVLADAKLKALDRSITATIEHGVAADANIVMAEPSHAERVARIIGKYGGTGVSVRLLNDLGAGDDSYRAIYEMLADLQAEPKELYVEAGTSNSRVRYELPNSESIYFKQLRRTTLPDSCSTCSMNNDEDCLEGYYGVRLYVDSGGRYLAGVCLQRMDLTVPVEEFVQSPLASEIVKLKTDEAAALQQRYKERLYEAI